MNSKTSQVDQNQGLFPVYLCFYKNHGLFKSCNLIFQIQGLSAFSRTRGTDISNRGAGAGSFRERSLIYRGGMQKCTLFLVIQSDSYYSHHFLLSFTLSTLSQISRSLAIKVNIACSTYLSADTIYICLLPVGGGGV